MSQLPGKHCPPLPKPDPSFSDLLEKFGLEVVCEMYQEICAVQQRNCATYGIFPDDAVVRRVLGRKGLLIGGFRALMLQIGHPFIAQGVADFSRYRTEPQARLQRTTETFSKICYGNVVEILYLRWV
jgi:hypothetical protein